MAFRDSKIRCGALRWLLCMGLVLWAGMRVGLADSIGSNSLTWQKGNGGAGDIVSADLKGERLWPLLEDIARQTGWHILVEPGADMVADVKFSRLSEGDALKKLLGNLDFALVPQTNAPDQLFVFMTSMQAATRAVAGKPSTLIRHLHVPNQLMVQLKPGASIDALAKALGAKVIGRNEKDNIYLLQFADPSSTDSALTQLQNDPNVQSVGYNNIFDPPPTPQAVASAPVAQPSLTLDSSNSGNSCNPVIGLIDTQVQPLGNNLSQFLKPAISVVGQTAPITGTVTHGTAMAETILNAVAQTSGGRSGVQILPVNVYSSGDTTTSWNVALGVQAAVDNGANILNMSLGSVDNSGVLANIIQQAQAQGVVVFAAAGNVPVASDTYPAALPGVNAVTALSAPGQLASYANYGNFVEMALPGTSFVSLAGQDYMVQGTSPATAYASGIAASVRASNCSSWPQIDSYLAQKFPVPAGGSNP